MLEKADGQWKKIQGAPTYSFYEFFNQVDLVIMIIF
jgi:hypothetical protein